MAILALALERALEPVAYDREMRRRKKTETTSPATPGDALPADAKKPDSKSAVRKRRRGLGTVEDRIQYRFTDAALLDSALTHVSALKGKSRAGNYQRLEFLGDHVLGLVVSDMLFRAFPKGNEGELSRRLADLVRRETCAEVARAIDLGPAIRLGTSEVNSGGRLREAVLADVCEAVIGAVFLDGGYSASAALVERLWDQRMRMPVRPPRDPKTILQEWAQARGLPTPAYLEVARTGPHHNPEFRVSVQLPNLAPAEGMGRSKRAAEQAAAAALLDREGVRMDRAHG